MEHDLLNPKRQEQAKEYAKIRRRFMLIDLLLGLILLLAWIFLGWATWLRDWIFSWTDLSWLAVLVFGMIFGLMFTLFDLPLAFYTGYVLPHKYQQSNQTLSGWWSDLLKSLLLSALIGAFLLEVIFLILRTLPSTWWLWAGGFLLLFNVVIANLAPVLLFPIFYEFIPLGNDHVDLQERLIKLADKAGARVKGVYKFDMSRRTKSANAGLTGLGNTRRIILGDTLIEEFTPDEIETILAHELGHHKNQDIPLGMIYNSALTIGGLYLTSLGLNWGVDVLGFTSISDIAALPLFALSIGIFGLFTLPLSNGFSRWREEMADDFALELTGKGDAYASALTRLSNQNLAEVDPDPWVEIILHSHPAINKRIEKARSASRAFNQQDPNTNYVE
jgi:STE24 endopeptidase